MSEQLPSAGVMEACASASYWAREMERLGHEVKLIAPHHVRPFVKRQKNDSGRTSAPDIFAAADCASFPHRGARLRLESVPNAIEHAEATAAAMLDRPVTYAARPWFWSEQYDVKLQIAGLNAGHDRVVVRCEGRGRSHWYFRGPTLVAVDAMKDPRSYMAGKRLIEGAGPVTPEEITDPATDLAALLKRGAPPLAATG